MAQLNETVMRVSLLVVVVVVVTLVVALMVSPCNGDQEKEQQELSVPLGDDDFVSEAVCVLGLGTTGQGATIAGLLARARMVVHVYDEDATLVEGVVDNFLNVEGHSTNVDDALKQCDVVITCYQNASKDLEVLRRVADPSSLLWEKPWIQLSGNLEDLDAASKDFASQNKLHLIGMHTHQPLEEYGKPYCEFYARGEIAKASWSVILFEIFAAMGRVVREHRHEEL